jgi:predicted transcriptional regulator
MEAALDQEIVNKTTNLLSILSKKDALSIFLLAKEGLRAETDTPQKIGLTRKQYYTRLKQLVDAGLIDKSGPAYTHTTLGTFVHQRHLVGLLEHVRNVKQMRMVDTLKRTRQFSEEEISNFVNRLTGTSLETSSVPQVRFIASYEELVSMVIDNVQLSKNEIFLATRYANDLVINNIAKKSTAGLHVKIIVDWNVMEGHLKSGGPTLSLTDKNAQERLTVTSNPFYPHPGNLGRRFMNVPYSVMVVDRKEVGIELVDRNAPERFSGAIFVKDPTFAIEAEKLFNGWWQIAEERVQEKLQNKIQERP